MTFLGPVVIAYILFMTYSALGGEMSVQKVYTCLAILNITRLPIALFPLARAAAIEANTSLERIRKYLLSSEAPSRRRFKNSLNYDQKSVQQVLEEKSLELAAIAPRVDPDLLVSIRGGYFKWLEDEDRKDASAKETKTGDAEPMVLSDAQQSRIDDNTNLTNKEVQNAASSNDTLSRCAIKNVNLTINRGDLVAIVGPVGSG